MFLRLIYKRFLRTSFHIELSLSDANNVSWESKLSLQQTSSILENISIMQLCVDLKQLLCWYFNCLNWLIDEQQFLEKVWLLLKLEEENFSLKTQFQLKIKYVLIVSKTKCGFSPIFHENSESNSLFLRKSSFQNFLNKKFIMKFCVFIIFKR